MEIYKYNTLEEAEIALEQVNTYFGLPSGNTLRWTDIEQYQDFWYLSGDRINEVLGEPTIFEMPE